MKKYILIIASIFWGTIVFGQSAGTQEVNNLKLNGKIKTKSEALNTSPDLVLTQDTANDITTQTGIAEVQSISISELTDSLSKQQFDSINTVKIIVADSSAIGISSDGGVLATTETVLEYIKDSVEVVFSNGLTDGKLGGTLIENTTLDNQNSYQFRIENTISDDYVIFGKDFLNVHYQTANKESDLSMDEDNFTVDLRNYDDSYQAQITSSYSTTFASQSLSVENPTSFMSVNLNTTNGMIITDGINSRGLENAADYSNSSNARSLVDSGQVAAMIDDNLGSGVMKVAISEILYTNTTQTLIITLPANAVIWNIGVNVTTIFNDTGTDYIDIGVTGTPANYLNDYDASITSFGDINSGDIGLINVPDNMTGSTNITFQYTGQNSNATQGVAEVYIHYSKH